MADLKVFALSLSSFDGSPRRAVNLRKACKKEFTSKESVISKWTALVDIHVNKET